MSKKKTHFLTESETLQVYKVVDGFKKLSEKDFDYYFNLDRLLKKRVMTRFFKKGAYYFGNEYHLLDVGFYIAIKLKETRFLEIKDFYRKSETIYENYRPRNNAADQRLERRILSFNYIYSDESEIAHLSERDQNAIRDIKKEELYKVAYHDRMIRKLLHSESPEKDVVLNPEEEVTLTPDVIEKQKPAPRRVMVFDSLPSSGEELERRAALNCPKPIRKEIRPKQNVVDYQNQRQLRNDSLLWGFDSLGKPKEGGFDNLTEKQIKAREQKLNEPLKENVVSFRKR